MLWAGIKGSQGIWLTSENDSTCVLIDDGSSGGGHSVLSSGSEPVYFPLFALEMHEQGRYLELGS